MLSLFLLLMLLTITTVLMLAYAEETERLADANEACGFDSAESGPEDVLWLMKRHTARTGRPAVRPPRTGLTVIGQDADKIYAQEKAWEQDSGIRRYIPPAPEAAPEAGPAAGQSGQGAA